MSLHIKWTQIALQSLSDVFEYTFAMFGQRQLTRLRNSISKTTNLLASFPLAGKRETTISECLNIEYRSIIVIKEIKLVYTCSADTVFIEYVWNTRKDEDTIKLLLANNMKQ